VKPILIPVIPNPEADIKYLDFPSFKKIRRFSRGVVVTEKIDGTNGLIYIDDTGNEIYIGSHKRWLTTEKRDGDNHGFARWGAENRDELLKLGPGHHYGEWWGQGINSGYGMTEKRFSLFNVKKWASDGERPKCCHVVPTLWEGSFDELDLKVIMHRLKNHGSYAAPGFMDPEGVIIYHVDSGAYFKKTFQNDEWGKGQ
jgi:hypothetical protein